MNLLVPPYLLGENIIKRHRRDAFRNRYPDVPNRPLHSPIATLGIEIRKLPLHPNKVQKAMVKDGVAVGLSFHRDAPNLP